MDAETRAAALAALAMQVEFGADEAIGDAPVDRFAGSAPAPPTAAAPEPPAAPALIAGEAVADAHAIAAACTSLPELEAALAAFDAGPLKQGARSCVFADGMAGARVMIVGEAPGREEDLAGKPFVGRSGQLLDRMLACIGLDRTAASIGDAVYITNILPWRPVANRTPGADEVALMMPFVARHIALAAPEIVIPMGSTSAQALTGQTAGILRLRGRWSTLATGMGTTPLPALPMLHPAYLLRNPPAKRMAWRDLLGLRAALDGAIPGD